MRFQPAAPGRFPKSRPVRACTRPGSLRGFDFGLTVMSQSETAGLGSKVAEEPFLSQFPGIEAQADALNASVDTITGATVSSRAVLTGVSQAMEYYQTNLKQGG